MVGSGKYQLSTGAAALYEHTAKVIDNSKYSHIVNPCLTKDTWILTTEGPRQIIDLINKEFTAVVNGEKYKSTGFWSTGIKKVYQLKTDRGYSIKATENHQFKIEISRKQKFGGGYNVINEWKEVGELKNKDKIILNNQRGNSWEGYGDVDLGWLLGQIVGDGGHNDENGITYLRFWGKSQHDLANIARDIIEDNFKVKSEFGEECYSKINKCTTIKCVALNEFASKFIESKTKNFLFSLEKETSSLFIKGFIKGFFDADGTVANNSTKGSSIRLGQSDLVKLQIVQRMLARFGIISTIYTNRRKAGYKLMPDSNRELKEYYCKAQHELVISKDNINEYYEQIGFEEPEKYDKLEEIINNQKEIYKEKFLTNLEEVIYLGEEEVFDCTVNGIHAFDANGLMSHNCGEISLNAKGGYCVIGDIVPFFCNALSEVKETARLAARFLIRTNLMDAIYSDEVRRTNRIGVGMTGLHEFAWKFYGLGFYDLIDESKSQMFWDFIGELRETVENEAASYSQKLGLNTPHTCTTMKPSGSISKLYALTEGAHLPARRFYLRWVQFQNNDPLIEQYREEGYPVKPLKSYPNVSIVGFPTQPLIATLGMKDKLVTASEATPEEQYKWLMLLEKYWLGEGNNQISYTMKVSTEKYSLEDFRNTFKEYQSKIRCCSVLPIAGDNELKTMYEYLPEENISEEEFKEIQNRVNKTNDVGFSMDELQCSSGACPL